MIHFFTYLNTANMKTTLTRNGLDADHQRDLNARLRGKDPEQFEKKQAEKC